MEARSVPVAEDGTITLSDFIEPAEFGAAALGLAVAIDLKSETLFRHVPIDPAGGAEGLLQAKVQALEPLASPVDAASQPLRREVRIWAREMHPLGRYRTQLLRLPADARLEFATTIEPFMEEARDGQLVFRVLAEQRARATLLFEHAVPLDRIDTQDLSRWENHAVDLGSLEGQDVRLVFETALLDAGGNAIPDPGLVSALWGTPTLRIPGARPRPGQPNVIVISLDTLRADHLGCYGYTRETSPHIDRFAAESFLFETCVAPSSWTAPSHATFFTGLHPSIHRVGLDWAVALRTREGRSARPQMLGDVAQRTDYFTAGFTEGVGVSGKLGFAVGYDYYTDGPTVFPTPMGFSHTTFANAEEWVRNHSDVPFFLFVHTYEIHWPYRAPPAYNLANAQPEMAGKLPADDTPEEARAQFVGHYDAGIHYADEAFGRFFDTLRALGLLDNTAVLLFSDHGEQFWEHKSAMHGKTLYDEELLVPFILRLPGAEPAHGRVQSPVALIDGFATVLDLMHIAGEPREDSFSLLPLCVEAPTQTPPRVEVLSHLDHLMMRPLNAKAEEEKVPFTALEFETLLWTKQSMRTGEYKYIRSNERAVMEAAQLPNDQAKADKMTEAATTFEEALYDLQTDPGESNDLSREQPERTKALRDRHDAQLKKHTEAYANGEARDAPGLTEEDEDALKANAEKLKAMGYL